MDCCRCSSATRATLNELPSSNESVRRASTHQTISKLVDASLRFLSSVKFGITVMIALAVVIIVGGDADRTSSDGQSQAKSVPNSTHRKPRQILEAPLGLLAYVFPLGLSSLWCRDWLCTGLYLHLLSSIDRFGLHGAHLRQPGEPTGGAVVTDGLTGCKNFPYSSRAGFVGRRSDGSPSVAADQTSQLLLAVAGRSMASESIKAITAIRLAVARWLWHASLLLRHRGRDDMIRHRVVDTVHICASPREKSVQPSRASCGRTCEVVRHAPAQIRCNAAGVEHYTDGTPGRHGSSDLVRNVQNGRGPQRQAYDAVNQPEDYGGIVTIQRLVRHPGVSTNARRRAG